MIVCFILKHVRMYVHRLYSWQLSTSFQSLNSRLYYIYNADNENSFIQLEVYLIHRQCLNSSYY